MSIYDDEYVRLPNWPFGRYYAFVESVEPFQPGRYVNDRPVITEFDALKILSRNRRLTRSSAPMFELQLECVGMDYFDGHLALHEFITPDNTIALHARRQLLKEMRDDQLRSLLLLISDQDGLGFDLNDPPLSAWIDVSFLVNNGQVPAVLSSDASFSELVEGEAVFHDGSASSEKNRLLRNAFSLDFLRVEDDPGGDYEVDDNLVDGERLIQRHMNEQPDRPAGANDLQLKGTST